MYAIRSYYEEAGLRHLPGLYLAEIERDGSLLPAVPPTEILRGGDRLVFVGMVDSVVDLYRIRGLIPAPEQIFKLDSPRPERRLFETVVSDTSPLVGKSIRVITSYSIHYTKLYETFS